MRLVSVHQESGIAKRLERMNKGTNSHAVMYNATGCSPCLHPNIYKQNERHIVSILSLKLAISILRIKQKTLSLGLTISPVNHCKGNVSFSMQRSVCLIFLQKYMKFKYGKVSGGIFSCNLPEKTKKAPRRIGAPTHYERGN